MSLGVVRTTRHDPTIDYDFLRADVCHKEEVTNLILNGFLAIEPHAVAFGLNARNGREYIERVVAKSLKHPYSFLIIHKATGKLIGVRLMSVCERRGMENSVPRDLRQLEEGVRMYTNLFDKLESNFWHHRPEANRILRREITFVHSDHQRRGIAQHLLFLGLDFDRLRASGVDGIISEASAYAHQMLLLKKNFKEVARPEPEEYIRSNGKSVVFPDKTKTCIQLYLSIQQRAHL